VHLDYGLFLASRGEKYHEAANSTLSEAVRIYARKVKDGYRDLELKSAKETMALLQMEE